MPQGKSHTGYVCFVADFYVFLHHHLCISLSEVGNSAFGYLGGTCVVWSLLYLNQILRELLPHLSFMITRMLAFFTFFWYCLFLCLNTCQSAYILSRIWNNDPKVVSVMTLNKLFMLKQYLAHSKHWNFFPSKFIGITYLLFVLISLRIISSNSQHC